MSPGDIPRPVGQEQQQPLLLPYRLVERRSTRARYIRVEIRPQAEVLLVYPHRCSRAQALAFLREREPWVLDQLHLQREREARLPQSGPLRWDGEDRLLFQGEWHRLSWAPAPGQQPRLTASVGELQLLWPAGRPSSPLLLERHLRQNLVAWARVEAESMIAEEAPRLGVTVRRLRLNDPRRQWGSCTRDGRVSLSWRLLLAPPAVFRYVVVHELCHLRHADHSPRFWALVAQQQPGYETAQQWLREQGHLLHGALSPATSPGPR